MNMVEAVRDAILTWDPNEEENLDEGAVRQVAAYLVGADYRIEDIVEPPAQNFVGDDKVYFLYDALKWTVQNGMFGPSGMRRLYPGQPS